MKLVFTAYSLVLIFAFTIVSLTQKTSSPPSTSAPPAVTQTSTGLRSFYNNVNLSAPSKITLNQIVPTSQSDLSSFSFGNPAQTTQGVLVGCQVPNRFSPKFCQSCKRGYILTPELQCNPQNNAPPPATQPISNDQGVPQSPTAASKTDSSANQQVFLTGFGSSGSGPQGCEIPVTNNICSKCKEGYQINIKFQCISSSPATQISNNEITKPKTQAKPTTTPAPQTTETALPAYVPPTPVNLNPVAPLSPVQQIPQSTQYNIPTQSPSSASNNQFLPPNCLTANMFDYKLCSRCADNFRLTVELQCVSNSPAPQRLTPQTLPKAPDEGSMAGCAQVNSIDRTMCFQCLPGYKLTSKFMCLKQGYQEAPQPTAPVSPLNYQVRYPSDISPAASTPIYNPPQSSQYTTPQNPPQIQSSAPANCLQPSSISPSLCFKCADGYRLNSYYSCEFNSPIKTPQTPVSVSANTSIPNCVSLAGGACTKCRANFNLFAGQCVFSDYKCVNINLETAVCKECISGFNVAADGVCVDKGCRTSVKGYCISCNLGLYLNYQQQLCMPIPVPDCEDYVGNSCLSCRAGFKLTNNKCVPK